MGGKDQKFFAVKLIVILAVAVVGMQVCADINAVVGIDCNVAAVKQCVDVGAQKQTVGHGMCSLFSIGLDVRRLQNRQCLFAADCTSSLISICHTAP